MEIATLEERLMALEAKVAKLTDEKMSAAQKPWWEQIAGTFENNPEYDAAMALGRAWWESFRPKENFPRHQYCFASQKVGFLIFP